MSAPNPDGILDLHMMPSLTDFYKLISYLTICEPVFSSHQIILILLYIAVVTLTWYRAVLMTITWAFFQSKFEFKLRLQEFIELVRANKMMDAIHYARKYLSTWGLTNMKELQQAMATLAFKSNTDCPGYKVLLYL